jgi:hypothetical protein
VPIVNLPLNTTNAVSYAWDLSSNPATSFWTGGSSPVGSFLTINGDSSPAFGGVVAFSAAVPSTIELPTNAIISSIKLKYNWSVTNSAPSGFAGAEAYITGAGPDTSYLVAEASPSIGPDGSLPSPYSATNQSITATYPNGTITSILTRASFISYYCQTPYIGSLIFVPTWYGPFVWTHNQTSGFTSSPGNLKQISFSNISIDVTYTSGDWYYNPVTNHYQFSTDPGPPWQPLAPFISAATVNPTFGSTSGGD